MSLFKKASLFIEDFGIVPKHASEKRPLATFPLSLKLEHPLDVNEWLSPLMATSDGECHSIRCLCSSEHSTLAFEIPERETRIEIKDLLIESSIEGQSSDLLMATQICKVRALVGFIAVFVSGFSSAIKSMLHVVHRTALRVCMMMII